MRSSLSSSLCLATTALIWGTGFVAQKMGMDNMGPFFFTSLRMFFGGTVLLLIYLLSLRSLSPLREKRGKASAYKAVDPARRSILGASLRGGMACGAVLYLALITQQIGIVHSTAGKVAFISVLYILIVPLLGLFLHQRVEKQVWGGVVLAMVGLYFLCIQEDLSIAPSDSITLVSSLFWALHILCMDHFAPKANAALLTSVQCYTTGIIGILIAPFVESLSLSAFVATLPALLWAGIMATGVAFLFQALGQKGCPPTLASILLSLETVFAALAGYLFLHEVLSGRELLGCALMFGAILLAQLPGGGAKEANAK